MMFGDRVVEPLTEKALRAKAIQALARREHSRYELEKKLLPWAESPDQVQNVLDVLVKENLLSDQRYAQSVSRVRGSRFGARRVALELEAKGVDDRAIASVVADLEQTEWARASATWQKKFGVLPATPAERGRQQRFMLQRGFSPEIVSRILTRGSTPD